MVNMKDVFPGCEQHQGWAEQMKALLGEMVQAGEDQSEPSPLHVERLEKLFADRAQG